MFLVLIFTRDWVDPRAMVRSEGNMSLKNPVTPPGIGPGTVRLVAQRLKHYATPGPLMIVTDTFFFYKYENWFEFHYSLLKCWGNTKYIDDCAYHLPCHSRMFIFALLQRVYTSALHECPSNHQSINQIRTHPVTSSRFKYSILLGYYELSVGK